MFNIKHKKELINIIDDGSDKYPNTCVILAEMLSDIKISDSDNDNSRFLNDDEILHEIFNQLSKKFGIKLSDIESEYNAYVYTTRMTDWDNLARVSWIKFIRVVSGIGLKDAKDYFDKDIMFFIEKYRNKTITKQIKIANDSFNEDFDVKQFAIELGCLVVMNMGSEAIPDLLEMIHQIHKDKYVISKVLYNNPYNNNNAIDIEYEPKELDLQWISRYRDKTKDTLINSKEVRELLYINGKFNI